MSKDVLWKREPNGKMLLLGRMDAKCADIYCAKWRAMGQDVGHDSLDGFLRGAMEAMMEPVGKHQFVREFANYVVDVLLLDDLNPENWLGRDMPDGCSERV